MMDTAFQNTGLEAGCCVFCDSSEQSEERYGKFLHHQESGIHAHYYCMLFACGLSQQGENNEGLEGFLIKDILAERRRAQKLRCKYCKKKGASVGCSVKACHQIYHYGCGLTEEAIFLFYDSFVSYCVKHRPVQKVLPSSCSPSKGTCPICLDKVETQPGNNVLKTPCCKGTWLHRECVQTQALSAGYFFRCAICNNENEFQDEMRKFGIYIPEKDAEWEYDANAYQELYERHNRCDVDRCRCPRGRKYSTQSGQWEMVLCDLCGSAGCHVTCGGLVTALDDWACKDCTSTFTRGLLGPNTSTHGTADTKSTTLVSQLKKSTGPGGTRVRSAITSQGKRPRPPPTTPRPLKKQVSTTVCPPLSPVSSSQTPLTRSPKSTPKHSIKFPKLSLSPTYGSDEARPGSSRGSYDNRYRELLPKLDCYVALEPPPQNIRYHDLCMPSLSPAPGSGKKRKCSTPTKSKKARKLDLDSCDPQRHTNAAQSPGYSGGRHTVKITERKSPAPNTISSSRKDENPKKTSTIKLSWGNRILGTVGSFFSWRKSHPQASASSSLEAKTKKDTKQCRATSTQSTPAGIKTPSQSAELEDHRSPESLSPVALPDEVKAQILPVSPDKLARKTWNRLHRLTSWKDDETWKEAKEDLAHLFQLEGRATRSALNKDGQNSANSVPNSPEMKRKRKVMHVIHLSQGDHVDTSNRSQADKKGRENIDSTQTTYIDGNEEAVDGKSTTAQRRVSKRKSSPEKSIVSARTATASRVGHAVVTCVQSEKSVNTNVTIPEDSLTKKQPAEEQKATILPFLPSNEKVTDSTMLLEVNTNIESVSQIESTPRKCSRQVIQLLPDDQTWKEAKGDLTLLLQVEGRTTRNALKDGMEGPRALGSPQLVRKRIITPVKNNLVTQTSQANDNLHLPRDVQCMADTNVSTAKISVGNKEINMESISQTESTPGKRSRQVIQLLPDDHTWKEATGDLAFLLQVEGRTTRNALKVGMEGSRASGSPQLVRKRITPMKASHLTQTSRTDQDSNLPHREQCSRETNVSSTDIDVGNMDILIIGVDGSTSAEDGAPKLALNMEETGKSEVCRGTNVSSFTAVHGAEKVVVCDHSSQTVASFQEVEAYVTSKGKLYKEPAVIPPIARKRNASKAVGITQTYNLRYGNRQRVALPFKIQESFGQASRFVCNNAPENSNVTLSSRIIQFVNRETHKETMKGGTKENLSYGVDGRTSAQCCTSKLVWNMEGEGKREAYRRVLSADTQEAPMVGHAIMTGIQSEESMQANITVSKDSPTEKQFVQEQKTTILPNLPPKMSSLELRAITSWKDDETWKEAKDDLVNLFQVDGRTTRSALQKDRGTVSETLATGFPEKKRCSVNIAQSSKEISQEHRNHLVTADTISRAIQEAVPEFTCEAPSDASKEKVTDSTMLFSEVNTNIASVSQIEATPRKLSREVVHLLHDDRTWKEPKGDIALLLQEEGQATKNALKDGMEGPRASGSPQLVRKRIITPGKNNLVTQTSQADDGLQLPRDVQCMADTNVSTAKISVGNKEINTESVSQTESTPRKHTRQVIQLLPDDQTWKEAKGDLALLLQVEGRTTRNALKDGMEGPRASSSSQLVRKIIGTPNIEAKPLQVHDIESDERDEKDSISGQDTPVPKRNLGKHLPSSVEYIFSSEDTSNVLDSTVKPSEECSKERQNTDVIQGLVQPSPQKKNELKLLTSWSSEGLWKEAQTEMTEVMNVSERLTWSSKKDPQGRENFKRLQSLKDQRPSELLLDVQTCDGEDDEEADEKNPYTGQEILVQNCSVALDGTAILQKWDSRSDVQSSDYACPAAICRSSIVVKECIKESQTTSDIPQEAVQPSPRKKHELRRLTSWSTEGLWKEAHDEMTELMNISERLTRSSKKDPQARENFNRLQSLNDARSSVEVSPKKNQVYPSSRPSVLSQVESERRETKRLHCCEKAIQQRDYPSSSAQSQKVPLDVEDMWEDNLVTQHHPGDKITETAHICRSLVDEVTAAAVKQSKSCIRSMQAAVLCSWKENGLWKEVTDDSDGLEPDTRGRHKNQEHLRDDQLTLTGKEILQSGADVVDPSKTVNKLKRKSCSSHMGSPLTPPVVKRKVVAHTTSLELEQLTQSRESHKRVTGEETSHSVKKKRGRPRKQLQFGKEETPQLFAKKIGRPRKYPNVTNQIRTRYEKLCPASTNRVVRPKKQPIATDESTVDSNNEAAQPSVKKVGRPRKHPSIPVEVMSNRKGADWTSTKKIGRPRKYPHVANQIKVKYEISQCHFKKLGRPRKQQHAMKQSTLNLNNDVTNQSTLLSTTKAGRPRKYPDVAHQIRAKYDKVCLSRTNEVRSNRQLHLPYTASLKSVNEVAIRCSAKKIGRPRKQSGNPVAVKVNHAETQQSTIKKIGRPGKFQDAVIAIRSNNEEVSLSSAKKCGRPRKYLDVCDDAKPDFGEVLQPGTKKRGRPRKNADVSIDRPSFNEAHFSSTKKPGRPRKRLAYVGDDIHSNLKEVQMFKKVGRPKKQQPDIENEMESDNKLPKSTMKKRGRPRKYRDVSNELKSSTETHNTKKLGRPRKYVDTVSEGTQEYRESHSNNRRARLSGKQIPVHNSSDLKQPCQTIAGNPSKMKKVRRQLDSRSGYPSLEKSRADDDMAYCFLALQTLLPSGPVEMIESSTQTDASIEEVEAYVESKGVLYLEPCFVMPRPLRDRNETSSFVRTQTYNLNLSESTYNPIMLDADETRSVPTSEKMHSPVISPNPPESSPPAMTVSSASEANCSTQTDMPLEEVQEYIWSMGEWYREPSIVMAGLQEGKPGAKVKVRTQTYNLDLPERELQLPKKKLSKKVVCHRKSTQTEALWEEVKAHIDLNKHLYTQPKYAAVDSYFLWATSASRHVKTQTYFHSQTGHVSGECSENRLKSNHTVRDAEKRAMCDQSSQTEATVAEVEAFVTSKGLLYKEPSRIPPMQRKKDAVKILAYTQSYNLQYGNRPRVPLPAAIADLSYIEKPVQPESQHELASAKTCMKEPSVDVNSEQIPTPGLNSRTGKLLLDSPACLQAQKLIRTDATLQTDGNFIDIEGNLAFSPSLYKQCIVRNGINPVAHHIGEGRKENEAQTFYHLKSNNVKQTSLKTKSRVTAQLISKEALPKGELVFKKKYVGQLPKTQNWFRLKPKK